MRIVSIGCSILLVTMLIIMQHHSVEAKPFIFKFFVPQAPARTASSSSSSSSSFSSSSSPSVSTGIDFTSILSTKLNLLTSLLRTGVSGGFNIGFKKFFPNIQATSTRRPYTSTTATTPDVEFEAESTTKSIPKSTTTTTTSATTTTTESSKSDKSTGSDNLSEPIDDNKDNNKVTTERYENDRTKTTTQNIETVDSKHKETMSKNNNDQATPKPATVGNENYGYDYTTSKAIVDRNNNGNGYGHTTSRSITSNPNGYGYSTPRTDYNYDNSNYAMSENEISNEIMRINNQYLPTF